MPSAKLGAWYVQAVEKGLIREPSATPAVAEPESQEALATVAPGFFAPGCWTLPIETASEANGRDWRKRSNRTQAARKVVSEHLGHNLIWVAAFAAHYHAGGSLRVVLTRLGGRQLDRSNLPTALKATEDAVALMLGANDGDPRWLPEWHQEPGGAVGVRVDLSVVEGGAT